MKTSFRRIALTTALLALAMPVAACESTCIEHPNDEHLRDAARIMPAKPAQLRVQSADGDSLGGAEVTALRNRIRRGDCPPAAGQPADRQER